jgi:hypothetical protein
MKIYLLLVLLLVAETLYAQCRPANEAENQAYNRIVQALQSQLTTKTPTGEWRVFDEKHSMGSLEVTSEWGGFVHLCSDRYDLTIERTTIATARQAMLDTTRLATTTPPSLYVHRDTMYHANPEAAKNAQNIYTVSVEMNLGNYRLQDTESARIVTTSEIIQVAGSTLALEVTLKPDLAGAAPRQETVVLLGGWNLKPVNRGTDVRYQPQFKKGGKLFENLVITITAPFDIARQVVKQIDWQALSNSLL